MTRSEFEEAAVASLENQVQELPQHSEAFPSRQLSLAITNLEQAAMWLQASITAQAAPRG